MTRRLVVVAVLALASQLGCSADRSPPSPFPDGTPVPRSSPGPGETRGGVRVPVIHVTDGDTIRVLHRGREERVRLIGIDAPEASGESGGECFAVRAFRYLERRLIGRHVELRPDVRERDRYGRLLAYVFVGPELVNLTLVRSGYAQAYPVPPDLAFAEVLANAERDARARGVGLWSACRGSPSSR